jgi:quinol monooxygenase YgiN
MTEIRPQARLLVLARYGVAQADLDWALGLIADLAAASRAEAGNRGYDFYLCPGLVEGDDGEILIVERYATAEDFAAHRASDHFQRLAVRGLIPQLTSREIEEFPLG